MIKFRKHFIQNTETGKKCRVRYNNSTVTMPRKGIFRKEAITVYAKDYSDSLEGILDFRNKSDGMIDYFETDRAVLFPDNPLFKKALKYC
jgi:hypothetical protein